MPPKKDNAPAKKDAKVRIIPYINMLGGNLRSCTQDGVLLQDSHGS